jgi:hypothetical protein
LSRDRRRSTGETRRARRGTLDDRVHRAPPRVPATSRAVAVVVAVAVASRVETETDDDDDDDDARGAARRRVVVVVVDAQVRSIHWSPYDRVRVVNAVP